MGGTARNRAQPRSTSTQPQPRSQGPGLLGTAFNLLGSVLASRQAQSANRNARRNRRRPSVDDMAYEDDHSDDQQRTLYSDFPESSSPDRQHGRRSSFGRTQSPRRRKPYGGETRRSRSYRKDESKSSRTNGRSEYVEDYSNDDSDESSEYQDMPRQQDTRNAFSQDTDPTIDALENAAEHHRREALKCRDRLQQLSRQPMASSERLQHLATEVHRHETAYENAREKLKLLRDQGSNRSQHGSQYSEQRRRTFAFEDGQFARSPQPDFESFFFGSGRSQHPGHGEQSAFGFDSFPGMPGMPFDTFHSFFNGFGPGTSFVRGTPPMFSIPGATFSFGSQSNARSTPRSSSFRPQGFSNFTAQQPPTPPANLLKPEEAKRLFKTYNERWNSLGPTDPNIPYPARKLHSSGLLARDSIWAPMVSSPITAWSEEVVMRANAQAFYLGVVGLSPQYTEAPGTGKIVMAYNKAKATPAQVKELVDKLKKEKTRWHSDRLGRRNGGQSGANEALQRDEKTRAVFHAVCELMETAQGV